MEQEAKKRFLINLGFVLAIAFIALFALKILMQYLFPLLLAVVTAWLVQKPARLISNKIHLKKSRVAAFLSVALYLITGFAFFFFVYEFAVYAKGLLDDLPDFFNNLTDFIPKAQKSITTVFSEISPELAEQIGIIISDIFKNLRNTLSEFFSSFATNIAAKTPTFIISCLVALVASCYIAKDYDGLLRFLRELIGKRIYENLLKIKLIFAGSILKLMKGYLILTGITFIELFIGFSLFGIKYAFLSALLISFVDLLPVFGTGTVLIPWGISLVLLGDGGLGIKILFLYLVITVLKNFLEPKIIGSQIGINPLFTLIAMFAGLKFFGFLGLIIFPVTFIVIIKYYKNEMEEEAEKNLSHRI